MGFSHIQPSFGGGELSPHLYGRVDLAKRAVAVREAYNLFVEPEGGLSNLPGTKFVCEVEDSADAGRITEFSFNEEDSYVLIWGDLTVRFVRNGGLVLETAQNITGVTQANPAVVTIAAHGLSNGNEVYIADVGGMTQLNTRNFLVANVTTNTFELQTKDGTNLDATSYGAYTSGGTASRVYQVTTPFVKADLFRMKYAQTNDVIHLTHPSYAPRKLSRTGHTSWTLETITFQPDQAAPTSVGVAATAGTGSTVYKYKVTAVNQETGEESLPSVETSTTNNLSTAGNYNTVSWATSTAASKYNVYKEANTGVFGFAGFTDQVSFKDENIDPDKSDTPPQTRNPFNASNDYPGTITFFEQRSTWGNSNNNPSRIWLSQSANIYNMNVSEPTKDNDAITVTLVNNTVNEIRHMVALDDLIVFTGRAVWRINGGSDDFLTPDNPRRRVVAYRGSSHVPPLTIGETVMFLQAKGARVRGFRQDTVLGDTFEDLSILAQHLFQGYTITDWAYAEEPHSLVWMVRSDGKLNLMCYIREHDVWGITQAELPGGTVESVTVIPGTTEDQVYLLVKRTINSRTVRYVEHVQSRLFTDQEDAYFVHCGLTYSGAAATTFSGLWHVEGEEVVALANGSVRAGLTVTNGQVTLSSSATKAHIGLPSEWRLRPLPFDQTVRSGSTSGKPKHIDGMYIRLKDARGIEAGPDLNNMDEMPQEFPELWEDPPQLLNGDYRIDMENRWSPEGDFYLRGPHPVPATILAIMPEVSTGE